MQWTLTTSSCSYAVSVLSDGSGAVLDYWGMTPVTGGVRFEPWSEPDRMVGFVTAADVQPLEYASAGQRHVEFGELLVDRGDGSTGASWTFRAEEASFTSDGSGDRLELPFDDETGTLRLTLVTATRRDHDVVRRNIRIRNAGSGAVELPRVLSAGWNLPLGRRARIDYLAGAWAHEFQPESIDLGPGAFTIGSRQGVTGLQFSPVMTLTPQDDGETAEQSDGTAYGIALDWSGSWMLRAEVSAAGGHVRVSGGVDPDTTTVSLLPGEEFITPDALGVFSSGGPEGVTAGWHDFQRRELARDLAPENRPIVYNSWYATEFDVRIDHQLHLAERAASLGVEVFVVDDGWFTGRVSDEAGLGDWTADPIKFPNGLAELAERVLALGMRFGLWVEPEGVSPDSELFRAHPEWVYRAGARPLETVRNQYVLDLGREDVLSWVEDTLRSVLRSAPISYLKWDMNRAVSDGGRPGDPHGRQWSIQHTRGYYRVLRMLRTEFPHVTIEACASGGGRIDNAVLALSDVVWTSDEVGPRDRLAIQHGFLSAYPAWVMSSWVADTHGHRDRLPVSLGYRFAVAMAGVLGIGSDLLAWTDAELAEAAERVASYRGLRSVIQRGVVRRHGRPDRDLYCLEYLGPEDDPRVVVLVYDRDRDRVRDQPAPRVFLTGLRPGVVYRVTGSAQLITDEIARSAGIVVPFEWARDADILVLEPVG